MDITLKAVTCAVDLSARSEPALARAVRLASDLKLWLNVLHVVDHEQPQPVRDRQSATASEHIRTLLSGLDPAMAAAAHISVLVDDPVSAMARFVAGHERGLLVLGAPRRREGWRWPFSTHTAGRMLRAANGPVLVVTKPVSGPYTRVLTAVDWSIHSRRAVELAFTLAPDAEHRLLHAWQIPYEALQPGERPQQEYAELSEREMRRFIDDELVKPVATARAASPSFRVELAHRKGEPQIAIREVAEAMVPELVVLGTRGHSGLQRAFLGSVAESVLSEPPCDVLVAMPN